MFFRSHHTANTTTQAALQTTLTHLKAQGVAYADVVLAAKGAVIALAGVLSFVRFRFLLLLLIWGLSVDAEASNSTGTLTNKQAADDLLAQTLLESTAMNATYAADAAQLDATNLAVANAELADTNAALAQAEAFESSGDYRGAAAVFKVVQTEIGPGARNMRQNILDCETRPGYEWVITSTFKSVCQLSAQITDVEVV